MSETVLFGKIKDPELIVLIFGGQRQCRMGEARKTHRSLPKTLELKPNSKRHEENLEHLSLNLPGSASSLREGSGDNT